MSKPKTKPEIFEKYRCGVIESSMAIMGVVNPVQDFHQGECDISEFVNELTWLERRLDNDNWDNTGASTLEKAAYDSSVFQLAKAALVAGKKYLNESIKDGSFRKEKVNEAKPGYKITTEEDDEEDEDECQNHAFNRANICRWCGYKKPTKKTEVVNIDECNHKESDKNYTKIGKQYSVECRICHFIRKPTEKEIKYYFTYETSEKCDHERNQLIGGPYGLQFQCTMNHCGYVRKATKKEFKEFHKEEE